MASETSKAGEDCCTEGNVSKMLEAPVMNTFSRPGLEIGLPNFSEADGTLSDFIVMCKGKKYHVHKIVLCSASIWFGELMKADPTIDSILLPEDFETVVEPALKLLYTGVGQVEQSDCRNFFALLKLMEIPRESIRCDEPVCKSETENENANGNAQETPVPSPDRGGDTGTVDIPSFLQGNSHGQSTTGFMPESSLPPSNDVKSWGTENVSSIPQGNINAPSATGHAQDCSLERPEPSEIVVTQVFSILQNNGDIQSGADSSSCLQQRQHEQIFLPPTSSTSTEVVQPTSTQAMNPLVPVSCHDFVPVNITTPNNYPAHGGTASLSNNLNKDASLPNYPSHSHILSQNYHFHSDYPPHGGDTSSHSYHPDGDISSLNYRPVGDILPNGYPFHGDTFPQINSPNIGTASLPNISEQFHTAPLFTPGNEPTNITDSYDVLVNMNQTDSDVFPYRGLALSNVTVDSVNSEVTHDVPVSVNQNSVFPFWNFSLPNVTRDGDNVLNSALIDNVPVSVNQTDSVFPYWGSVLPNLTSDGGNVLNSAPTYVAAPPASVLAILTVPSSSEAIISPVHAEFSAANSGSTTIPGTSTAVTTSSVNLGPETVPSAPASVTSAMPITTMAALEDHNGMPTAETVAAKDRILEVPARSVNLKPTFVPSAVKAETSAIAETAVSASISIKVDSDDVVDIFIPKGVKSEITAGVTADNSKVPRCIYKGTPDWLVPNFFSADVNQGSSDNKKIPEAHQHRKRRSCENGNTLSLKDEGSSDEEAGPTPKTRKKEPRVDEGFSDEEAGPSPKTRKEEPRVGESDNEEEAEPSPKTQKGPPRVEMGKNVKNSLNVMTY